MPTPWPCFSPISPNIPPWSGSSPSSERSRSLRYPHRRSTQSPSSSTSTIWAPASTPPQISTTWVTSLPTSQRYPPRSLPTFSHTVHQALTTIFLLSTVPRLPHPLHHPSPHLPTRPPHDLPPNDNAPLPAPPPRHCPPPPQSRPLADIRPTLPHPTCSLDPPSRAASLVFGRPSKYIRGRDGATAGRVSVPAPGA